MYGFIAHSYILPVQPDTLSWTAQFLWPWAKPSQAKPRGGACAM